MRTLLIILLLVVKVVQGAPLDLLREAEGHLDVHVRLEERPLDVPDDVLHEGGVHVGRARDLPKGVPQGASEGVEDHRGLPMRPGL